MYKVKYVLGFFLSQSLQSQSNGLALSQPIRGGGGDVHF